MHHKYKYFSIVIFFSFLSCLYGAERGPEKSSEQQRQEKIEERRVRFALENPLHWASLNNKSEHVEILLRRGHNVDEKALCILDQDEKGHVRGFPVAISPEEAEDSDEGQSYVTPLELATIYGHSSVVQKLLEHGAAALRPRMERSGVESETEKQSLALHALHGDHEEVLKVFWANSQETRLFTIEGHSFLEFAILAATECKALKCLAELLRLGRIETKTS
jgi:ankyrin repeat protein